MRKLIVVLAAMATVGGLVPVDAIAQDTQAASSGDFEGLVDVDEYRLFVRCTGQGSPTVILEAALGNSSQTWRTGPLPGSEALLANPIEPAIANFTRVCVYDRPGTIGGRSDPAPTPRTTQDMVDDLRALLDNDQFPIPGPYVLVGHSFGGWIVQLFARLYPEDVVGVVLIDATPLQWIEVSDRLGIPVPTVEQNPERVDLRKSAEQVLSAPKFPNVPLIVLVAPGNPAQQADRYWNELQAAQAELSPRGELIFVEGAGHFIHRTRPEVVIDSILRLVEAARRPGKGCGDTNHAHERKAECKTPEKAA